MFKGVNVALYHKNNNNEPLGSKFKESTNLTLQITYDQTT